MQTGKEKKARQETVTDVGSTDGLDNEDAVPADGATNPPDEDPKTDDPVEIPSRNKKIKLEKALEYDGNGRGVKGEEGKLIRTKYRNHRRTPPTPLRSST
jgi:hypothetical protein